MNTNKFLFSVCLLIAFLCSCSSQKEQSVESVAADSVAAAMLAEDDFDTAKVAEESEKEEVDAPRYVADTPNEAIDLMNSLPGAEYYRQGILPRLSQENLGYAMRLLNDDHNGFIIVDKETMKVALYDKYGRERLKYGIACGKNFGNKRSKGDSRTPEGFFSVEGVYDSTDWLFTDDNGRTSKVKGQFGPRFIRLRIPTTSQIGIHGTRAPWSIGKRCSHGCIRVTNENIMELVKHVTPGMPVIVSPSRRDEKVNSNEGHASAWVSVTPGPDTKPGEVVPATVEEPAAENDSVSHHAPEHKVEAPADSI
ncbi:MAG: L,D-transpeptidase [Muribaculaceae bacterium]|nr:L,D-transpeptidase [Muribaculaceae bacterium]